MMQTQNGSQRHRTVGRLGSTVAPWVGALLLAAAAGCAGGQNKPDQQPSNNEKAQKAQQADKAGDETGDKTKEAGQAEAMAAPLMEDGLEPEVQKLESADGVTAWKVGGLKVLHKPTKANSVVSAKLYLDGGVLNFSDDTAGIEQLALRTAVNGGTASTSKDEFNAALASMGSSVSYFTDRDFSGYQLHTISKHFDQTWELFTQAVLQPAMPAEELETQRQKQLASIAQLEENPNRLVSYTARELLARDHPYHRFQMGTRENVEGFSRHQVARYHNETLLKPERMLLVVVGNISSDRLLEKVKASVGRLKQTDWERPEVQPLQAKKRAMEGVEKTLPTNYILGLFPAPRPGEADYAAMMVATSYLADRLFEVVRTKHNLSYAVSSGIGSRRANAGYLYVSAKQPNITMKYIFEEVEKLKQEPLSADEVKRTRNVFITDHYMGIQTNSGQASVLAGAELIAGDWTRQLKFLEEVKQVTAEDIQRVAKKYFDGYHFGVVGSPDEVDASVFGLGNTGENAVEGSDPEAKAEQQ